MIVRTAVPDDAPAVVALRAAVYPYLVRGVESTRNLIANPPPGEDWTAFVVESGSTVAGWASAFRNAATSAAAVGEISLLHVHPDHRGQGAGAALFDAAHRHLAALGIRQVRTWALQPSLGFAEARGFSPSRELRYSALSTRQLTPVPPLPDGIRLAALDELDARVLYRASIAAGSDEPGDIAHDAVSFDTWCYEVWHNPGLDRSASTAAVIGDTVVAFTLVKRDGDRMWSDMTATLPEYRGRGIARLIKSAALHRAAERGVTMAYTSNDEANAPMLAINARLGYRQVASQWSCLATLV